MKSIWSTQFEKGKNRPRKPRVGVEILLYSFLNLGARWGWVVNANPGQLTRHPLYRRLGWPQRRSGVVRKILYPPGFDLRTVQAVASRYTDWAIPAHPTQLLPGLKCGRVQLTAPIYDTNQNRERLYLHAVSTLSRRGVYLNAYPTLCTSTLYFTAIQNYSRFPKRFNVQFPNISLNFPAILPTVPWPLTHGLRFSIMCWSLSVL